MIPAENPARLSVSLTNGLNVEIRLGVTETRIGRGSDADLLLPDPSVSRLHARIFRVGGQYFLADASRNGTYLDGRRVTQVVLDGEQTFRIGPYHIHFLPGKSAAGPDPPTAVQGAAPAGEPHAPTTISSPVKSSATFGLEGESPFIRKLIDDVRRVGGSGFPVLVQGETGSGKELVSRGVHDASSRRDRPFVVVNCGAISPELIESELFGHEKGSFTGATAQRRGAFEIAHGGTIFLDEIGELPLALQPKLLRALEQKEIKRVGGNETILVDVRVIAATNRNLREEMGKRTFRDDLFFRLGTITLNVPPLRERREDVVPIARLFLEEAAAKANRSALRLSDAAAGFLASHDWPGNVRELRNAIQRAVVMGEGPALTAGDFSFLLAPDPPPAAPAADSRLSRWEQTEKNSILAELARQKWNKTRTAHELGIAKSTLFEKLRKYGIRSPESGR